MDNVNNNDFSEGSLEWLKVFEQLQDSYAIVQQQITDLSTKSNERYEGIDRSVVKILRTQDAEKLEMLLQSIKEIFTTRIDYIADSSPFNSDVMYVGAIAVPEAEIVSWAAPLAGDLMYKRRSIKYSQKTLLILQTQISHNMLNSMRVMYADASVVGEKDGLTWMTGDQYLRELLASTNRAELRHIVQTIQMEQYKIISQDLTPLEIVQGAPGTGKTSVALHRLAYLLTNDESITPDNVLLLGPNDVFLGFVKDVLPSLGFMQITSVSLINWLTEKSKSIKIEYGNVYGEHVLAIENSQERLEFLSIQSQLVSGTMMKNIDLLLIQKFRDQVYALSSIKYSDAYMNKVMEIIISQIEIDKEKNKHTNIINSLRQFVDNRQISIVEISGIDLVVLMRKAYVDGKGTYNEIVDRFIKLLVTNIREKLKEPIRQVSEFVAEIKTYFSNEGEIGKRIRIQQRKIDNMGSFREDDDIYSSMLQIRSKFKTSMADIYAATQTIRNSRFNDFDSHHHALKSGQQYKKQPTTLNEQLLWHFIELRINGVDKTKIQSSIYYVVIDEAQDLNPLLAQILRYYLPNARFSLYGDIAQNIFQDVQNTNWNVIAEAFDAQQTIPQFLLTTYRSTSPIMKLAERVLSHFPIPNYQYANAVMTAGSDPIIKQIDTDQQIMEYAIRLKKQNPKYSHAVVFKTRQSAQNFISKCAEYQLSNWFVINDAINQSDRIRYITVTYGAIVKGLEFDEVVVANFDELNYPKDDFHARLLYVVITRAAKELHLLYGRNVSQLLL
jgi:DNA helicase-2/ATP-dependent DNA helicase PcrA